MSLTLSLKGKQDFRTIAGVPYSLWTYVLVDTSTQGVAATFAQIGAQAGITEDPQVNAGAPGLAGLGWSNHIDIKDPALFPNVPELGGSRLIAYGPDRQIVFAALPAAGANTVQFTFIAPTAEDAFTPVNVIGTDKNGRTQKTKFLVQPDDVDNTVHIVRGPAAGVADAGGASGGALAAFAGTLPYASEVLGIYQPLAGWIGQSTTRRVAAFMPNKPAGDSLSAMFSGVTARAGGNDLSKLVVAKLGDSSQGILSPVGLVTLYRQYFFEFDTFLGAPAGHIWISPGGTVEVIESSTRRTLIEQTASQSEQTTQTSEETLTDEDDLSDAVKQDNATDTKLGASATAGATFAGIIHADASASFSHDSTMHSSSETTHKYTRQQSSKLTSQIQRNFKTTFKTTTESTDVTSRRYVVQNTTGKLVNYELRRKMRNVGVQVQHIGTRLSWQVFLDNPGADLGLGELVHVVPAPDLSGLKRPDPPPVLTQQTTSVVMPFPILKVPGTKVDPEANEVFDIHTPGGKEILTANQDCHIIADFNHSADPPSPGYTISGVALVSTQSGGSDTPFVPEEPIQFDAATSQITVVASYLNSGDGRLLNLNLTVTWDPPKVNPAEAAYEAALADYQSQVADLQRRAYGGAVRDRLQLVSSLRRRPGEDLRDEERQTVYGRLIGQLGLFTEPHIDSELISQLFDVDDMLYFTAPDYWRPAPIAKPPRVAGSLGRYPVPPIASATTPSIDPLGGETVASWYSHTGSDNTIDPAGVAAPEWRINYLITEDTQPAPLGSSLGWLIAADADDRRNEFLNAAWVKAVLPVRPGHELQALAWLAQAGVEGEAGLDEPYPLQPGDPDELKGKTLAEALQILAAGLQAANTDMTNTLAAEKVFQDGFDPLVGGFRPAEPYQVFDAWEEVLPTDQIVALEVQYDPKTGKLM